jgi:hypothetical protein
MEKSKLVVVDTNVLLVASEMAEQADKLCVRTCIEELENIQFGDGLLVLDSLGLIVDEYSNKLTPNGDRMGDRFLRWLLANQFDPVSCNLSLITPIFDHDGVSIISFDEFPKDPLLANFDISDRKFVAVAIAHPAQAEVLNAADSDWQAAESALNNYSVSVRFLCPELLVY